MECYLCVYDSDCQVKKMFPDITGCEGRSKYKPSKYENVKLVRDVKELTLEDFKIGDTVIADANQYTLRMYKLPGYLSGNGLKVIGFTKKNVICDWDGGKPFHIPPCLLRIKEKKD